MKKLVMLFGFLLSFNVFANIPALGANATEPQKQVIRDGAQDFCDGKEDDEKEECVMDFFANHNLEEEPSCD
ncbi:MAG: hypothetical protein ABGX45_01165 [Candidatus Thioglobus sp.]